MRDHLLVAAFGGADTTDCEFSVSAVLSTTYRSLQAPGFETKQPKREVVELGESAATNHR